MNVSSDTGSPGQFRTKGSKMVVVVLVVTTVLNLVGIDASFNIK